MNIGGMFKKQKTREEIEEEIEREKLGLQLDELLFSRKQKQEMLARLKAHGVSKKSVGGTWEKAWAWLKAH